LVDDLNFLVTSWAPDADNYRRRFEAEPEASLAKMLTGIAVLSKAELASQRIDVALTTGDQEDEQSCFSDNTHNDLFANALGIQNVWLGRYPPLHGRGLYDLLRQSNPALAERTDAAVQRSLIAVRAIPYPFDQVIKNRGSPGYQQAQAAVQALFEQADRFLEVATALHLSGVVAELPKR
jgi:putative iron-regulated protein